MLKYFFRSPPSTISVNGEWQRKTPFNVPASGIRSGPIIEEINQISAWTRGIFLLRAFKLDHLKPVQPLFFSHFCNFFSFILGSPFLLPQRANIGKGEISQPQKRMRQWVFSAWGIQTGPFTACTAPFVLINFQLFHFHTGEPILITPEGQYWKRGIH